MSEPDLQIQDAILFADGSRERLGIILDFDGDDLVVGVEDDENFVISRDMVLRGPLNEDPPDWFEPVVVQHPAEFVGLAFTASAEDALGGRAWVEFQRILRDALAAFGARTQQTASAWFGPLEGMDRYNRPATLVAVWFVFDRAACTEDDLAPLYESLQASPVRFTAEGFQPLGAPSLATLLLHDGVVHQVWLQEEPQPVAMSLELTPDGDLEIFGQEPSDSDEADFLPEVRHARLRGPDGEWVTP